MPQILQMSGCFHKEIVIHVDRINKLTFYAKITNDLWITNSNYPVTIITLKNVWEYNSNLLGELVSY